MGYLLFLTSYHLPHSEVQQTCCIQLPKAKDVNGPIYMGTSKHLKIGELLLSQQLNTVYSMMLLKMMVYVFVQLKLMNVLRKVLKIQIISKKKLRKIMGM